MRTSSRPATPPSGHVRSIAVGSQRDHAKQRRQAQRIADGERPPSPSQLALLEAIANPRIYVACAPDSKRPGRLISWIYQRGSEPERLNVTATCDAFAHAGLIEIDDPNEPLTAESRGWRLTALGHAALTRYANTAQNNR
jgi:hypothetical protein